MKHYQYFLQLLTLAVFLTVAGCRSTAPATKPVETTDIKSSKTQQQAKESAKSKPEATNPEVSKGYSRGLAHRLILWAPNRVLDVFDIMRVRLRFGFGLGLGARATKYVAAYAGSYTTIYAGLPGPRCRRMPRSPVGLESYNGAKASVVDLTVDGGIGPDYSPTEFGASFQLILLGIDVGVDPFEVVDFAGGIMLWDPRQDDL
ncbi:MAG: hypothetical protein L3J71_15615 [Victivallaceae bacterium]|nr:hypothetical protein [Victivallaceae bacterium]